MPSRIDWEELAYDHGFKGDDAEMLFQMHHVGQLSQESIATKLGISSKPVHDRLKLHGIEIIKVPTNSVFHGPRLPGWRK